MKIIITLFLILLINCPIYSQVPNWEFLGLQDTVISDIAFDDSGNIYIVSQPIAVYKSTDNGNTWKPKNNGITASNGTSIDIDSKGNIYLSTFGGVFKSTNGGDNWFRIAQELTNLEFHHVKLIPNDYVFVSNFDGIFRSTDYGLTWDSTDYTYWGGYEIGINKNGIMFVSNFSASWFSIFRSTNLGENWIFSSRLPGSTLLFSKNGDVFAGVGNNPLFDSDIYKSIDNGLTWNRTNAFITSNQISYQDLELDMNNDFYVIVSGDYNGVYFSADTGKSWMYYGLSDLVGSLHCLAISNGYVYVGTLSDGLFRAPVRTIPVELVTFNTETEKNSVKLIWITATETNNYGFEVERKESNRKWIKIGFVQGRGTSSEKNMYNYKDENLKPGEYFYRLKQIDYDGSFKYSSEVKVTIENQYNFNLEQNFPNPFNPGTTIKFTTPQRAFVNLIIYNSLGEKLKTLINSYLPEGNHSVEFKLADSTLSLCSGVYFYRLEIDGYSETKKMILIR